MPVTAQRWRCSAHLDENAVWNVLDAVSRRRGVLVGAARAGAARSPYAADARHHRRCLATLVVMVTSGGVARPRFVLLARLRLRIDVRLCSSVLFAVHLTIVGAKFLKSVVVILWNVAHLCHSILAA